MDFKAKIRHLKDEQQKIITEYEKLLKEVESSDILNENQLLLQKTRIKRKN
jgi:hypothetical protein